jgi:hypothetical protein
MPRLMMQERMVEPSIQRSPGWEEGVPVNPAQPTPLVCSPCRSLVWRPSTAPPHFERVGLVPSTTKHLGQRPNEQRAARQQAPKGYAPTQRARSDEVCPEVSRRPAGPPDADDRQDADQNVSVEARPPGTTQAKLVSPAPPTHQ